mgnify:CR=1 FL=1
MSHPSVRGNIIANFLGNFWAGVVSFLFIPWYIHYLGMESYGLIGFFGVLQGVFALLDLGLSATLNRELASASETSEHNSEKHHLVRTLEVIYWLVALVAGIGIVLLAPWLASNWFRNNELPFDTVRTSIALMGITLVFQAPYAFYLGGLMGLQRQILASLYSSICATLRPLGAIAFLITVKPTLEVFFAWQAGISLASVLGIRTLLRQALGASCESPRFQMNKLYKVWRFAAGMSGISFLNILLLNLDKIILSRILTLTDFGYYSLAATIAALIFRLSGPVFSSGFPRLTQVASQGNVETLSRLYHQLNQVVSVLVFPAVSVLGFFAPELLLAWTRNYEIANNTVPLLRLLLIGNLVNSSQLLPLALQYAFGWTRLALMQSLGAAALLIPTLYVATMTWGAIGAAAVWSGVNLLSCAIGILFMHKRLLPKEIVPWMIRDIAKPLVAAMGMGCLGRLVISGVTSWWWFGMEMAVVALGIYLGTALLAPATRAILCEIWYHRLSPASTRPLQAVVKGADGGNDVPSD